MSNRSWEQRGNWYYLTTPGWRYIVKKTDFGGWGRLALKDGDTSWELISTHPTAEEAMNG